jgi:tRNA pseudouridine(38-40) synthase
VWWVREPLDVPAMRTLATAFVGMRDFAAFTDDDAGEKSTKVLVEDVILAEVEALILIRIQGSHFLWKMVRRLVGVMAGVGRGEGKAADAGGCSTSRAIASAPRRGRGALHRRRSPPPRQACFSRASTTTGTRGRGRFARC